MLHIKTLICARIPIPKDRLAVYTNYSSVTKDQALEETALTLFHPVIHGCFQPVIFTMEDTSAHHLSYHDVVKGYLSKVCLESLVHTKKTATKLSLFDVIIRESKILPLHFYSLLKIFHVFKFNHVPPVKKLFNVEFFPNYGISICVGCGQHTL